MVQSVHADSGRWKRRMISVGGLFTLTALLLPTAPLWLAAAALVDLLTRETLGISFSVKTLMMLGNHRDDFTKGADRFNNFGPQIRMALD